MRLLKLFGMTHSIHIDTHMSNSFIGRLLQILNSRVANTQMPRFYAPSCQICPEGKGTMIAGALYSEACVGWAAKHLNPSFCDSSLLSGSTRSPAQSSSSSSSSSSAYLRDEGRIKAEDLEIVDGGERYLDGVLVFETGGAPGTGLVATFEVNYLMSVVNCVAISQ